MFRLKIALGFVLALALAAAGVYFTYLSLNRMSATVANAVKPDERLFRLKNLTANVNMAESAVRTFSINNDEKNLEPYFTLLSTINADTDTLKKLFAANRNDIDNITSLLKEKLDSYDELIDLRYNRLIDDAMQQLNMQVAEADSQSEAARQQAKNQKPVKGVFGLINKKKYEQKQKELDSLLFIKEVQSAKLKLRVEKIKEEQAAQLAAIASQELQLLEKDKIINQKLNEKIAHLEKEILLTTKESADTTISDVKKQQEVLLYISIAASAFILLLSIVIFADINRSNRYKKELEVSRNRAEQLAKFREEFLSNMSHELRTPVSALSGFSKKLEGTKLDSSQADYVKNISFASGHLLGIINDVLDIARIESGHLKLQENPVSIYETANEVIALLSIKALEKNIDLISDIGSVKDIEVLGDALRLRQVLFNVVGNAIKFTNEGSVTVKINTAGNQVEVDELHTFRIVVSDTGIGIAPGKIKNIFTPFEQADMGITRKFGGTGLGLSISKKIIELHKGEITAESKEGEGTTFTIHIPYKILSAGAENAEVADELTGIPVNEKVRVKTLIGLKILLAEDDELNRILQQSVLNDLGAHVDGVANGEEALMKLQTEKYDVVLMDLQMPVMGGIETAERIRTDLNSSIPVIAITANVHASEKEKCIESGMNAVVIKPFSDKQIADVVLSCLGQPGIPADLSEKEKNTAPNPLLAKPYNLDTLIKASNGNNDFVARMLKLFCMSGESLLLKAKEHLSAGQVEKAGESIHRLIPSCRQLSLDELSAKLKQLEDDCLEDKSSADILAGVNDCYSYFREVAELLNDEVAGLQKVK